MATKRAGAPAGLADAKKRLSKTKEQETVPSTPTSAAAWKKKTGDGLLLRVPSGNIIKIRTPGMDAFLTEGVIPNGLIPLIMDMMKQAKAGVDETPEDELIAMLEDRAKIEQIVTLANAVSIYCAVEPAIHPLPEDGEERDEELLYVDDVDFNDKMYIFAVATGGIEGLERFRAESGLDVGPVQPSDAVPQDAS